jgi:hypothetical protein
MVNRRHPRTRPIVFPLALLAPLLAALPAVAAEVRAFAVCVDDRPAGSYQLTVSEEKDGRVIMSAQADVRVRLALFSYTYSYRGREVWQNDRLQSVEATANDNGKQTVLSAVVQDNTAKITVNGKPHSARACQWTSTYWRLPLLPEGARAVALLDVDTGAVVEGRLQLVETVTLEVGGKALRCRHYRVGGPLQADLWFDDAGRLVQQDSVEDGHRYRLKLTGTRAGR